ncbi:PspC domain-containing protein [Sphingomonas morindae]|uniref:PspC domain-containing protein n=1 Tax=Sphingomonas morindae TaxID=1541170 RepID=A0ABY4XBS7_9SPHN|nr:PspC domain-containing protein [Sphingomonas morindae]USI74171.1 PspC domain-containing protein [Sphingomonas morindae]
MSSFVSDRRQGLWLGVCQGFAQATGAPVGLVRLAVLFLTLAGLGLPGILAYVLIGWLTGPR